MFIRVQKKAKTVLFDFLYGQGHFESLGVCRFFLSAVLFYIACSRQFNVEQYGENALIPASYALNIFSPFYKPMFKLFFWPDAWAASMHLVYIALMGFATLGLLNRPLMILTWVIAQGFIQRNFSILFGADIIGTLFFFYLSFTKCNEFFSVKNLIFKKSTELHNPDKFFDQISSVFFRLFQFQIFTIYTYTGFEKLKGSTWWDGTALWTILVNPQFTNFNLLFLKNFPIFFAIGTFVTLIFEIYFVAMVSFKKTRYWWLSLGVLFHLMIGVLLSLMPFSLIMIASYALFIDKNDLILVKNRFKIRH